MWHQILKCRAAGWASFLEDWMFLWSSRGENSYFHQCEERNIYLGNSVWVESLLHIFIVFSETFKAIDHSFLETLEFTDLFYAISFHQSTFYQPSCLIFPSVLYPLNVGCVLPAVQMKDSSGFNCRSGWGFLKLVSKIFSHNMA